LAWNDAALVHQFRAGLNDDVKDMLLHHPYPETLDAAISLAVSVGNRLFEHRQEMLQRAPDQRNSQRRPFQVARHGPSRLPVAAPAFDPSGPAPMEIGLMRRAPLSPDERQRRIENLCRYCGGQDLANCPLVPSKPKSKCNLAAVQGKARRQ
jgi:hypothetical protein